MAEFIIMSQWVVAGTSTVDADNIEAAIKIVKSLPIPSNDGVILSDTFEVDKEASRKANTGVS